MEAAQRITFLGTGTSQGVPVITCECKVCSSTDSRNERLRSSVLVQQGGANILIDAGPDFRAQMLRVRQKRLDAILLTHEHTDHIFGLDDVRAFNHLHKEAIDIYAEPRVQEVLTRVYHYAFQQIRFGGLPKMTLRTVENKDFVVNGIKITPIRGLHYKLPVFGYRIGNFAYITDMNNISPSEEEKLKGLDVLVVGAVRWEEHISHFSIPQAVELINKLGAKQGYLTHLSHYVGLHKDVNAKLPSHIQLAYDGLSIQL